MTLRTQPTQPNQTHRLYDDLAWVWPLLSPPGDYQGEAGEVHKIIMSRLDRPSERKASEFEGALSRLLELGSGGGHMLFHLQQWYDLTGSDLSEAMIRLSMELNPHITHVQADMRTIRLGETFDALLIHDALGYMQTQADLAEALNTAWVHLEPGGVLVLLPDEMAQTFEDHQAVSDSVVSSEGKAVTFVSHAMRLKDEARYLLTMLFLVRQAGKLSIIEDRHTCGLFSVEQWRGALSQAGFEKIDIRPSARWRQAPVLVAQKPA